MKKLRIYLALTLVVALIASIAAISSAEVQVEEDWQADIQTLMDESLLPKATTVQYDHALPEGTEQPPTPTPSRRSAPTAPLCVSTLT